MGDDRSRRVHDVPFVPACAGGLTGRNGVRRRASNQSRPLGHHWAWGGAMYIPRSLKRGPDYKESLDAARAEGRPKFDENLKTARNHAKFEPETAPQVRNSTLRISQVYDKENGYSLALYFLGGLTDNEITLVEIKVFDAEPDYYPW